MTAPISEQDVRTFVGGQAANYYLKVWESALNGSGRASGFNIAAFFLAGFWLPYRKMYKATLILYGSFLVETVIADVLFMDILKMQESPALWDHLVTLIVGIVCGICANGWYLSHTRGVIAKVRAQEVQGHAYERALAARGGTSLRASLGMFFLFLVATFMKGFVFGPFGTL